MSLLPHEIFSGVFSLIFVLLSIVIGATIALKYFKHKESSLIYIGITWILMSELWWSSAVSFLKISFTGVPLDEITYYFIGIFLVPVALLMWFAGLFKIMDYKYRKQVFIITILIGVVFEIFFMLYLFLNTSEIASPIGGFVDAEYKSFVIIYLLSVLFTFTITGVLFSRESLKVDDPIIRMKGKFLTIAVISFTVGAALDGLKPFLFGAFLDITLILNRIILISSAFEFYLGFYFPQWATKIFIKEI